jgi:hypothetical protein
MSPDTTATLRPIAFGSRRSKGNETKLQSHLGEGFAGNWAINKCRHMCYGQKFVWVTDCYAIKFILSYSGGNPAVLRLQMRLMGWDMDAIHWPDKDLVDTDYWLHLDANLCHYPLLQQYQRLTYALKRDHPLPTALPIDTRNMPYFRGPGIRDIPTIASLPQDTTLDIHLSIIPPRFDRDSHFTKQPHDATAGCYYAEITCVSHLLSAFRWAIYSFNSGHFFSSVAACQLSFEVYYTCNPFVAGRTLFHDIRKCAHIFPTGAEFFHHVRADGDRTHLHGYLIHIHRFQATDPTSRF